MCFSQREAITFLKQKLSWQNFIIFSSKKTGITDFFGKHQKLLGEITLIIIKEFLLKHIFEKVFTLSVNLWLKQTWISNFAEVIRENPIFYLKNLMKFSNFEDRLLKNQSIDCCEIRNVHAWCTNRLFLFFDLLWKMCIF